jgi:hypothetical protein
LRRQDFADIVGSSSFFFRRFWPLIPAGSVSAAFGVVSLRPEFFDSFSFFKTRPEKSRPIGGQ